MANQSGNAYGLTVLSPIKNGQLTGVSYAERIRNQLHNWGVNGKSPMAKVPETYLCRLFVLDDVVLEAKPGADFGSTSNAFLSIFSEKFRLSGLPVEDHLKSKYLVFSSNFHTPIAGDLDTYLKNMWSVIAEDIKSVWGNCIAFDQVDNETSFIQYMKRCQLTTSLFFVGSTDESLAEQLKSLYLKQEFAKFAIQHQGVAAAQLQQAFKEFVERVQPKNLAGPTWSPGQADLCHP